MLAKYSIPRIEHGLNDVQIAQARNLGEILMDPKLAKGGVANWFTLFDNGQHVEYLTQGCHANIGSSLRANSSTPIAVINEHGAYRSSENVRGNKKSLPEVLRAINFFYRWLMNESLYADVFVNKDPEDKYFILTTNCPTPWMQNCNILCRHSTEIPPLVFVLFEHFALRGYDKTLLYMLLFNTSLSQFGWDKTSLEEVEKDAWQTDNKTYDLSKRKATTNLGHRAHNCAEILTIKDMIQRRISCKYPNVFSCPERGNFAFARYKNSSYYGGSSLYSTTPSLLSQFSACDQGLKLLSEHRKAVKAEGLAKVPNPFVYSPDRGSQVDSISPSVSELVYVVLPWAQEKLNNLLTTEERK